ncbi:MAG: hypothetical protein E6Q40_02850, partial [Cupriavidus sp.]
HPAAQARRQIFGDRGGIGEKPDRRPEAARMFAKLAPHLHELPLAHHARLIQRQLMQMRGELGEHASGLRATIRLLANTAAIAEYLPPRLSSWMAKHPRTDIDLKERQSIEIARAVSVGLAEIGVLSSAVDTASLILRPFAVDRLVVVLSRDHALASARQIAFGEILHEHFIGLAGGALQDHIDAQAARLGTRLKMRVRMRTFESICDMAGQGIGLGIVPETAARRCGRSAKIAALRLSDSWATRQLSVCTRSLEDLPTPARDLFEHLATT